MNKFKILFLVILVVFFLSSCKSVGTNDVEQEKSTNTDSDILTGQTTPNYQIIGENKIALSSFTFKFPDDLSLLSDTVNPIAENSDGKRTRGRFSVLFFKRTGGRFSVLFFTKTRDRIKLDDKNAKTSESNKRKRKISYNALRN